MFACAGPTGVGETLMLPVLTSAISAKTYLLACDLAPDKHCNMFSILTQRNLPRNAP